MQNQEQSYAVQQLIGYAAAKDGDTIIELIQAMGLSVGEWRDIRRAARIVLSDADMAAAEAYMESQKNKKYMNH